MELQLQNTDKVKAIGEKKNLPEKIAKKPPGTRKNSRLWPVHCRGVHDWVDTENSFFPCTQVPPMHRPCRLDRAATSRGHTSGQGGGKAMPLPSQKPRSALHKAALSQHGRAWFPSPSRNFSIQPHLFYISLLQFAHKLKLLLSTSMRPYLGSKASGCPCSPCTITPHGTGGGYSCTFTQ